MSSNLKRKGGGNSGGDSSDPTHVLLHPSQVPYSHYTTSTRGSMSNGFVGLYRDDEDCASGLDYQHSHSAPHSTANSRRTSLNFSHRRSHSRPSTPPTELGRGRNDSDYWNGYGIDLGGGLSSSSSTSSLSGLPGISHERLGRGRFRMVDIRGLPSSRGKGMNIWKLLIRVLGGLGLAWIAFGLVRIGASRVRIIYSHWMNIPVELLDLCKDPEWTYHQPILLTTDPSMETSSINRLYSASTFFEIPADEPLYLLSQGNFSYGTVEFLPAISQDADWGESGRGGVKGVREQKIKVEIDAKYRDLSVFDWARVCMIGGESVGDGTQGAEVPTSSTGREPKKDSILSQVGVMVWTPETSVVTPKEYQLHLKIKVYVPPRLASRHEDGRARLPSIVTDLPTFEHRVGDLAPTVEFHKFKARTQKSILVESLRAESIFLQTVNKSVHGAMEAWSSIHVETSNASLDVNATLTPAPAYLHARYTELALKTSNAPLKSSVILQTDPRTPAQNVFKVTTRTSRGPLVVDFPPAPPSPQTVGSVDSPYPDSHTPEYDPSNARPTPELTSITSSETAKNFPILPEGSGSGGEKDPGPGPPVFASSGKGSISTSPSSSSSFSLSSSLSWPILRFDGHTTHGPVYVDLPPTFEGHFALRTSHRHQPRVIVKKRDGSDNVGGEDLVREMIDEVLEGGEVIKGTVRLTPTGSKKPKSSEGEGQTPIPGIPSNKDKTGGGTAGVPVAWSNVWTMNDRVELWV